MYGSNLAISLKFRTVALISFQIFFKKKKKTLQHKSGEDGEKKKKAKAKSVKNEGIVTRK